VPGSFAAAMKDEAKGNERNIVRLVTSRGVVIVEQIAGLIARRIECWAKEGQELQAGERYGLIRFGSQAAVHLPANAKALVAAGDRAVGGVTAIAEWTKAS
jgi:phosphatidylserine decarboxylase